MLNRPKRINGPIILMSNHPSAILDPILIGANQNLSIHYMVRADIFSKWLTPVFTSMQMIRIFRAKEDGRESMDKNKATFDKAKHLLNRGKAILFFAEGYTDDVFVRMLKPIKKGPVRLGFETLVENNWSRPLYLQAMGLNYTDPGKFRSELLYAYSELVDLRQFKIPYIENSAKTVMDVTRLMEDKMRNLISDCSNPQIATLVENVSVISRRGMNQENHDRNWTLPERYKYTKNLAQKLNSSQSEEKEGFENPDLRRLNEELSSYFTDLHKTSIRESWVYEASEKKRVTANKLLLLLFGFPFFIAGIFHSALPYLFTKRMVESRYKRKVFWSGVKLCLGLVIFGLWNLPAIFGFYHFIYPSIWLGLAYYFVVVPLSLVIWYLWKKTFWDLMGSQRANKETVSKFVQRRTVLKEKITALGLD